MTTKNKNNYTAVITVSSMGDSNEVSLSIDWGSDLTEEQLEETDFIPAAFQFVDRFILPALESAEDESLYSEVEYAGPRVLN